jgi:predicted metal-dependent hydrolase
MTSPGIRRRLRLAQRDRGEGSMSYARGGGDVSPGNKMEEIAYHVVRSKKRRKTLMLKIERDGRVVMHVPYRTSEREVEKFFQQKRTWVEKKLHEKEKNIDGREGRRQYVTGERFLYLGEHYPLELHELNNRRAHIALSHGIFYLNRDHVSQARELFIKWYKERAREIFAERVSYYSEKLKLYPKEITIGSAKTRYGSCTADNKLFFSFRLVMAPYPIIDYVIVHELVHIKIKNHSQRFWGYMEEVMPEYRKYRKWLKVNGTLLDI